MASHAARGEARRARVALAVTAARPRGRRARLAQRIESDHAEASRCWPPPRPPPTSKLGRLDAAGRSRRRPGGGAASRPCCLRRDARASRGRRAIASSGAARARCRPACRRLCASTIAAIAPRARVGGYMLSKLLPLIVVVMIMLGAFYPAIDITAGERERGTLETILSAPVEPLRPDDRQGHRRRDARGGDRPAEHGVDVADDDRGHPAGGRDGRPSRIPWTRAASRR